MFGDMESTAIGNCSKGNVAKEFLMPYSMTHGPAFEFVSIAFNLVYFSKR